MEVVTLLLYFWNMLDLRIKKYITIRNNKISINGIVDYANLEEKNTIRFLKSAYRNYGIQYGKFFKMDALSKLGFLASEVLLHETQENALKPEETSVILCNSASSLHTDHKYQATIADIPLPALFVYTLPNIVIGEICIRNGFRGEGAFLVHPYFDTTYIENYVRVLFETTQTKQCLTGWVEMARDDSYDAVLYLISRDEGKTNFTDSNLKHIFEEQSWAS